MAWIEVHQKLTSDSKVIDMSAELGVTQKHVIGMLVTFWLWAIDNAGRNGDLSKFSAYTIAAASGWLEYVQECRSNQRLDHDQRPDLSDFCHALVTASLINMSGDVPENVLDPLGDAHINSWEKYTNRYFDYIDDVENRRKSDRERKRRERERNASVRDMSRQCHTDAGVTVTPNNQTKPNHTIPKEEKSCSYGENEKQENQEPSSNTESSLNTDPCLNTESLKNKKRQELRDKAFEEIWAKYPDRIGKKAAYKHFMNSVITATDWENINKALENYLNSERYGKGYVQNGSTWFNNWADWVERNEPVRV